VTAPPTAPGTADLDRLRAALLAARYDVDSVQALLGPVAHPALARGERVPALRASADGTPLATLVRLFLVGVPCPEAAVRAAFAPMDLDAALEAGLVEPVGGGALRAALDLRPYGEGDVDWWVISDIAADVRPGPLHPDHVLGVGGASVTLAQATVRQPVDAALDLGVGCGVQSLHLSRHARTVTGTDVNPRALRLAAFTAGLNELRWELLPGAFYTPVAGRRFDLVISNPPFVIGPGDSGYTYRDSGVPGDAACRRLVGQAPAHLADGGWCQLLANWVHRPGEPWPERVAGWLDGTGCDAWVWQREVQDPAEYVAMWLRDAGEEGSPEYQAKYGTWLDWLAGHRVEAVGFGIVTLRAAGHDDPVVRVEDVRQPLEHPTGPHIAGWFSRQDWLRDHPAGSAALLATPLRAAPDLVLEQVARVGSGGWEVATQRLRQPGGLRWQTDVDAVTVALVAGCDGTNRLGDQLAVLANAYGYDLVELTAGALPAVRYLVERGFLLPG
jgi:methylase of polypeptide subunit release factors